MTSIDEKLRELGISLRRKTGTQVTTCPACSHTRKKKSQPCLSVTFTPEGFLYKCHHCHEFEGGFNAERERQRLAEKPRDRSSGSRGAQHQKRGKNWW